MDSPRSIEATDLKTVRALLDALPFYAFLVDSDHRIVVANRATLGAHGLEPSAIEGTYCPQTVHGVDRFPGCPLEASLANGCGVAVSEVFDERSGLWFETAVYPTGYRTSTDRMVFFHTARDITSAKRAEEGLEHRARVQAVLALLLRIALRDVPLEEQLRLLLQEIQSIPWLTLESKGAVFLVDGDALAMKVHNGLSESVASSCARVAFGQCHCGVAAQSGEIQFAKHLDERHRSLPGMLPHGHYCLPLQSPRGLLGVLCLYLPDGHQRSEAEEDFLRSVADIMAGIVEKARVAERTNLLRQKLDRSEEALERFAYYDPLTELPNRALLVERTRQAMAGARRGGRRVAVCVLEVDRFHTWEETLGLGGGDRLLLAVAARLGATIRESDTVARTGACEFTLLTAPCDGADGCAIAPTERLCHRAESCSIAVAGRLRARLAEPFEIDGFSVNLTASGGIAVFPEDGRECETLLRNAGYAMRRARELGGDRIEFYDVAMSERARRRLSLEAELRIAIENEQLVMHYQPQVELRNGRIAGAEALVRWQHPKRGLLSPAEFLPLAEETGLMWPLARWVLKTACCEAATWPDGDGDPLRLAVNVAPSRLRDPGFVESFVTALRESGLPPERVEAEITETGILVDCEATVRALAGLRELGLTIALDDFGTGYSSLTHLCQLPIGVIKIDRSFVGRCDDDVNARAIVRTVAELGSSLGMRIVAEGVETAEQLRLVERGGCDEAQGYLFARPLPADAFRALLATGERFTFRTPSLL